jgi:thioredoxin reductase (NADPH)
MSRYLVDRVVRLPNVRVMAGAEVRELHGDRVLEAITVASAQDGGSEVVSARALFAFIGAVPSTDWLGGLVDLDGHGFVRTGSSVGPGHLPLETSQPGLFAVGDVRSGSAKRVAAAVGEGAMVIRLAFERGHQA